MTIRDMSVDRRVNGTVDGAEVFSCHYVVRASLDAAAKPADFTAEQVIADAAGSPSPAVFANVIGALQLHGRAALSSPDTNDEEARITDDGAGSYNILFRSIPPVGEAIAPARYTLADVKAAPGAPDGADFDAVIAAFVTFGDAEAGYS